MSRRNKSARMAPTVDRKWLLAMAAALLVAAIALLVSMNRPQATVEYLVANRDLASGSVLQPGLVSKTQLALGRSANRYLRELPATGQLNRPVRAGELIAIDAISTALKRYSVVLSPSQALSGRVHVGSLVDVWFVAKQSVATSAAVPVRVATSLEVRSIATIDSGLSAGLNAGLSKVELAVAETDLPALMLASADGGFISVVTNG